MASRLRVLTFNIRHGEGIDDRLDLSRIADVIAASEADVVALQEVDRHFADRSEFADQAWWLGRELGMTALFGAAVRHPPPTPGTPEAEYGSAVLSRLPVTAWRSVPLPSWPGREPRVVLLAEVEARSESVRIACTHLSHEDPEPRLAQARALTRLLGDDLPTLLLGDLNADPDDDAIAVLTHRLTDCWAAVGSGSGASFPADEPRVRIDYVLASPTVRPEQVAVMAVGEASDHRAVSATVTVNPSPHAARDR